MTQIQMVKTLPLCSPTRSSVLTGLWPARTGITAPVCHVPQVLRDAGYRTGHFGKGSAAEEPERVRELNALITKFLADTGAVVPVRNPGYRGGAAVGANNYSPVLPFTLAAGRTKRWEF